VRGFSWVFYAFHPHFTLLVSLFQGFHFSFGALIAAIKMRLLVVCGLVLLQVAVLSGAAGNNNSSLTRHLLLDLAENFAYLCFYLDCFHSNISE